STPEETEYAFEMASSNIRHGEGVTKEVGMDIKNLGVKRVCIMTDQVVGKLPAMTTVLDSVTRQRISYRVFDNVRTEPTDTSFMDAIRFASEGQFDAFIALGGGSVIDTCKVANLYSTNVDADFFDYVDPPIGRGMPVTHKLKPLIAIPTTAGTGSETTGIAVFDYETQAVKTGIRSRKIRPLIGLIDPLNVRTMPRTLAAYTGFDVLCHALESYTALPYSERIPCPLDPEDRPTYQGSNPISDVWSRQALKISAKYFRR
ncbi:Hydroxyacid-oxoacid transhydrogenase, mitochondrial, partial [Lamellibrachia satsuma]